MDREPSLKHQREKSKTVLHTAVLWGRVEHVAWLAAEAPELISLQDSEGYTPLHLVGQTLFLGDGKDGTLAFKIGKILIEAGASLTQRNCYGETPLFSLSVRANAKGGWQRLIKFMITHGAEPNAKDRRGDTFLHKLVHELDAWSPIELVQLLVENGADPNLTDARGKTPLDLANTFDGSLAREPIEPLIHYLEAVKSEEPEC
ncbi:MAG: ankyrin repeat domain-containing protein [Vulcanimicrobiota bacterium]